MSEAPSARSGNQETLRILFVEDNPNDLELALRALRKDGCEVLYDVAKTPQELEGFLSAGGYQVLVSDFYLGSWDGLGALAILQRSGTDIPFILATGTLGEEKAVECLQAGVSDYLLKDRLSRLPAVIRRVLAEKSLAQENRRAEHKLKRSEEYFRSLIENVSDIISIVDSSGRLLYFSPSIEQVLGYKSDELIGRDAFALVHPDDEAVVRRVFGDGPERPQMGKPFEFRFRHADGSWRVLESRASHPRPGFGLTGMIVTSRDVTEHRNAEEELRESEDRFRATFEQAAVGMAHVALDGRWLKVNRKFCDIVGYSSAELLVKNFRDITHASDLPADEVFSRRMLAREIETCTLEKRFVRKDGWVVWVNVTASLAGTAGGPPKYFIAVIEDITERRKAEDAVIESEGRFRQLAENIQEVFWLATLNKSEIIYASPAFEKIWGQPCARLYERPEIWLQSVHPDDYARVAQAMERRRAGGSYDEDYRIERPDGVICWIRDRAFPIRDARGKVYRLAGIAEDITRNKQLEAQFLQSQKMESVGRLAGGVAHDFNNMLTAIGSFARLAMESIPADSLARSDLEQVLKATDRAVNVTRQLLTFARQQIFQPIIVDPNKVISTLEKMLSRLVRENIELIFRPGASIGVVKADPGQLDQVIINLVVNATDAMPDGGELTIETGIAYRGREDVRLHRNAAPGKFVLLAVSDTGVGMSAENQERLFEPFFTTKPVGKGTGLGLATVYGIVEQSGGHIEVSSRLGEGTTFRIYLPSVDETAQPAGTSLANQPQRQGTETIMLVEDQDDVRRLLVQILRGAGYSVLEASNGEAAMEVVRQHAEVRIDLLVSDVIMPKMGGRALAELLQKERPGLKILYVSGYTDHNFGEAGFISPEVSFLHKPFLPAALLAKVREVLDAPLVSAS